ncbi:MAG: dihydroneopterin aldolase [Pseudomonadota bacterium]|jgi:dihydroneopterin aldolase|nr:dihydroneopterin aldolase [Pseudomonadota bacterium]
MTLQRRIFLRDYEIIASIGIHEFERQNPQRIIVDVSLDLANDMPPDTAEDRIETVLDYDFLRDRIREIVEGRHFNLQETLCAEILTTCLQPNKVLAARVSTRKPDVYPDCDSVGVEMESRKR